MFDYIKGNLVDINPAYAILECNGIGYYINISLNSYSSFQDKNECKIYIHQVIREDAHLLFGFSTKQEREIFRLLISVSGIGANTARVILSSLSTPEIQSAISQNNVNLLTSIKGIGAKSAQRIIIELRDKIGKSEIIEEIIPAAGNTIKEESLSALVTLGFPKNSVEKVVNKIVIENQDISLEELVKKALKLL